MSLKGKVILSKQKNTGNCDFSIQARYMSAGFQITFREEAMQVGLTAFSLIIEAYPHNANYLQIFQYVYPDGKVTEFWIVHKGSRCTILLPEEY